ncbi:MAG: leucine-rich repeat protein [Muribaculaceae bacterium]|nr:leucine-rich repeat protein [Muribaculaceae bacterium]
MKKICLLLISLLVSLFALPQLASAYTYGYDFVVDGLCYKKTSENTVSVMPRDLHHEDLVSIQENFWDYYDYPITSYVGYTYLSGELIIPETVTRNGKTYTVTEIDWEAFSNCSNLTSVSIPSTIKKIGLFAFYGCTSLTEVKINDLSAWCDIDFQVLYYVESMLGPFGKFGYDYKYDYTANPLYFAHDLYLDGNKITDLVIPSSVSSIKGGAFYGCGINSVTITSSLKNIGLRAFANCSNLTQVNVDDIKTWCEMSFETTYLGHYLSYEAYDYDEEGNPINYWGTDYYNPIRDGDFTANPLSNAADLCTGGKKVTNLVIPNSVTSISKSAFFYCTDLNAVYSKIMDPQALVYGSDSIFAPNVMSQCPLYVPIGKSDIYRATKPWSKFANIIEVDSTEALATSITLNKSELSLVVGDTETLVAIVNPGYVTNDSVTWNSSNPSVATVNQQGKVTAVAAGSATITATTADGSNLSATCQLTVSKPIVIDYDFIEDGIAYKINSDNETLTITYTDNRDSYANNYPGLVTANIPMTVTHDDVTYTVIAIAEHAFRNCKTLESVTIPITLTSIGTYAFAGCEALTSMTVKSGNAIYDSRNGCNAIIEKATNRLVAGCKETVIPETVTTIGTFAFYEHHGIETIKIPSSVTVIERSAFNHILGLKKIFVPNSVVTLEQYVFSQCYALEEAIIGSGVTSLGQGCFYGCAAMTSLTSFIADPTTVTMGTNVFKNMDYENCVLHVPAGIGELYMNADQWQQFLNIVELVPGDANGDGEVTAADVTALYDYLLNNDGTYIATSDIDGDGEVTAADITAIYSILLGN